MTPSELLLLDQLNQRIQQHLDNPAWSVEELARSLGMSRSHLFRVVKEQTGLSPSRYIRQQRLLLAKELLQTTDLRVTQIADRVGFDSPQNLSTYFTETFGLSPTDYRKQQGTGLMEEAVPPSDAPADTPVDPILTPVPTAGRTPPGRRWHWRWGILGAGLLLTMGSLLVWWLTGSGQADPKEPAEASIAVLPFRNLGTAETDYFVDGVMEQIHASLTHIDNLRVISRTSSLLYEKTTKPVPQIARELGVTYLLEGRVLQRGRQVKLSVELIRAKDNQTIWADRYESDQNDLFGLMSRATKTIAGELNGKLSDLNRQKIDRVPTRNSEAYNQYLRGQYLLRNRIEADLKASISFFDRALQLDPAFGDACAGRAMAYLLMGTEGYGDVVDNYKRAEQNALLAIRLDGQNALAYATLGNLYRSQNKWEQANTTFLMSLRYAPNDALTNYWYSLLLRSVGELKQAVIYSTKAVQLDPLYPVILVGHIGNLTYAHRFDEAQRVIQEGERLHGSLYSWYWSKGFYYINRGEFGRAIPEFERGLQLNSQSKGFQTMLAYSKARIGDPTLARQQIATLPDRAENYPDRAILYAGLGDRDHCLQALEQGAQVGLLPDYFKVSPLFAFLHNEPRFRAVLQQVGLDNPRFLEP